MERSRTTFVSIWILITLVLLVLLAASLLSLQQAEATETAADGSAIAQTALTLPVTPLSGSLQLVRAAR